MFQKRNRRFLKSLEPAMKIGKIDGQIFTIRRPAYLFQRGEFPLPWGTLTDRLTSETTTIRVNPSSSRISELIRRLNELCNSAKRTLVEEPYQDEEWLWWASSPRSQGGEDKGKIGGEDKLVGAEMGRDLSPDFKELIEFFPRVAGVQGRGDIEEEKRAREYFRLSMFARPEKDVIKPVALPRLGRRPLRQLIAH
ncbi:hypothetical protein Fcan01_26777 [Folsomia candida]|uniref:Uncharacterized protein n=1 Tax=Folsomia candida TaxID=158441 RepID=A0A226CZR3_FOLCA|nr:hypothetical protein Fcan01_26777 [Folsomia candida]